MLQRACGCVPPPPDERPLSRHRQRGRIYRQAGGRAAGRAAGGRGGGRGYVHGFAFSRDTHRLSTKQQPVGFCFAFFFLSFLFAKTIILNKRRLFFFCGSVQFLPEEEEEARTCVGGEWAAPHAHPTLRPCRSTDASSEPAPSSSQIGGAGLKSPCWGSPSGLKDAGPAAGTLRLPKGRRIRAERSGAAGQGKNAWVGGGGQEAGSWRRR